MPWLPLSQVWNIWKFGYEPFQAVGSDSLCLATPNGNMLWTCDTAIIKQLFTLHTVQVPVKILKFYDIWGPTLGSVEGEEWKTHRKVVTYGLNPSTLPTVWNEAIHQTRTLIQRWAQDDSVIPVAKHWTSRLALHVIASVFFDMKLDWREYTQAGKPPADGYRISFENALFTVVSRLGMIFIVPRTLMRILPFKALQDTHIALTDWTKYMQQLRAKATDNIEEVAAKRNKTILESVVVAGTPSAARPDNRALSEESVLGNIFFTLMAGHETTGNSLAFALLLLAVHPQHQSAIQRELDAHFGTRPMDEWTVEHDYQILRKGYLGATVQEVLRVYNVVQFIFRITIASTTVRDSKGVSHTIPEYTTCLINVGGAFHNPSVWTPTPVPASKKADLHHSPAIEFDPTRFLNISDEDDETFWPFGYGPRKCPGMPFAQVEMIGVISSMLKDHSLELVVSEKTLQNHKGNRQAAWEQTRDEAIRKLRDDVESNMNIQMVKELPIRLVERDMVA
ncbi:cytochrome P450 [Massariosphaeria phaeospora]|uniref:Cytochrome P450 n=1 Tax=Massariosphaeria phaeospora TaxID=100035 RepID=A0A7C8MG62_9PLEO|nr:cytochrome P450 [Massariosphaeria phaeospora]